MKNPMTEEGFNALIGAAATKGNRLLIPRDQGSVVAALSPEDFADWLAESIKGYKPKTMTAPQHLYEFTIRKDGTDAKGFEKRLDGKFFVSNYAKEMMGKPEFTIGPAEESVTIRIYRADALGVAGWSETKFFGPKGWEHLKGLGLTKCLPDDAPCIREVHDKQELDEWIRVAHDPISVGGYSRVFDVGHDSDVGRCLGGSRLISGCKLGAGILVAVRVASQS